MHSILTAEGDPLGGCCVTPSGYAALLNMVGLSEVYISIAFLLLLFYSPHTLYLFRY